MEANPKATSVTAVKPFIPLTITDCLSGNNSCTEQLEIRALLN